MLAASLFHFGEIRVDHLKDYLALRGLPIRPAVVANTDESSAESYPEPIRLPDVPWESFKTDASGLVPAIIRDHNNAEILMMAWLNQMAWEQTLATGLMHYYSRSRQDQWLKGEQSGHFQQVRAVHVDCDADTLLIDVLQIGPACHTGSRSCFYRSLDQMEQ